MLRARLIERLRELLETDARVLVVYLFGSRARRDERSYSDVDVGVLFAQPPPSRLDGPVAALEARLEIELGLSVQLVALNTAPPDLIHRVLRDGEIVFDADPARRIRFEVKARNEYFDLVPYLTEYRKTG